MSGIPVTRCRSCGASTFPPRIWCGACGSQVLETGLESSGTVEEITILRYKPDGGGGTETPIGLVRLDSGPYVVARLENVTAHDPVSVELVADGIVARRPAR